MESTGTAAKGRVFGPIEESCFEVQCCYAHGIDQALYFPMGLHHVFISYNIIS